MLNEMLPGPGGLGTEVDAYVASVKRNPNNPKKWKKELVSSGMSDQDLKKIANQLKPIGDDIKTTASIAGNFIGDIIMMPIEARINLETDLYRAYAPGAESPDGSGNPISEEEREAAKKSIKTKTGPDFALEGILAGFGLGFAGKSKKAYDASKKTRTAKKAHAMKKAKAQKAYETKRKALNKKWLDEIDDVPRLPNGDVDWNKLESAFTNKSEKHKKEFYNSLPKDKMTGNVDFDALVHKVPDLPNGKPDWTSIHILNTKARKVNNMFSKNAGLELPSTRQSIPNVEPSFWKDIPPSRRTLQQPPRRTKLQRKTRQIPGMEKDKLNLDLNKN